MIIEVEVSVCSTCNGTDETNETDHDEFFNPVSVIEPCDNPDCVSGWVTQQGTIQRRHFGTLNEDSYLSPANELCPFCEGGTCGLVLVVPLDETTDE